jgi:hypothetical protein
LKPVITLLLVVFLTGCSSQRGMFLNTNMRFGEGKPVTVDGRRDKGEWDDALELPLSEGGHVLMKRVGTRLYLGLPMVERNKLVCIGMGQGDVVRVGHVSIYLSTAAYEREGEAWRRSEPYRSVEPRAGDRRAIEDHLRRTGWTASPLRSKGAFFMEICVELPEEGLRVALAKGPYSSRIKAPHWPPGLEGGLLEPRLLEGRAPGELELEAEKWPVFWADAP